MDYFYAKSFNIGIVNFVLDDQNMFRTLNFDLLQNQYVGGIKDLSVATFYRTCFNPSELDLWHFLHFFLFFVTRFTIPYSRLAVENYFSHFSN
ncbi:hypothetical protein BpHYR1_004327 [Brachionus plicatilis]|uniref:Uncharacterized protein n=1 Tax=Brachionus plicatilis TaxID=10195 RepID=A0A3M7SDQ0_BRAPC|nr:hypothetical protein BpHYR1_004327 [Brachionus plicatilis]